LPTKPYQLAMRPQPVRSCFHDVDDFRVRLNCPSARSRRGNKYLGKINWIFAQCGRLYLWVAVRCERTLQCPSKLYTNNFARLLRQAFWEKLNCSTHAFNL